MHVYTLMLKKKKEKRSCRIYSLTICFFAPKIPYLPFLISLNMQLFSQLYHILSHKWFNDFLIVSFFFINIKALSKPFLYINIWLFISFQLLELLVKVLDPYCQILLKKGIPSFYFHPVHQSFQSLVNSTTLGIFFFFPCFLTYGCSWAKDRTHTMEVTRAAAVTTRCP